MEKNNKETPVAERTTLINDAKTQVRRPKTPHRGPKAPLIGPMGASADVPHISEGKTKVEEKMEKSPRYEARNPSPVIRRKRRHSKDSNSDAAHTKKIKVPVKGVKERGRRRRKRRPYEEKLRKSSPQKRHEKGGVTLKEEPKSKISDEQYQKQLEHLAKFGKNFYCPVMKRRSGLRPIYIDGSNVAFSHGQNERFSVAGLETCIDYFRKRGHEVKAFVPHYRLRRGETTDQTLLHKLVTKKLVITTPTLYIQNQRRNPYDDWYWYIVQTAAANGGIIVSADNFQDIVKWNPNLRAVVEERRLVPTFVDDMLIFPVDPHGNRQNDLEQFLRF